MSDFNSLVQYTVENISRPVKYIIYKLTEFIRVMDKFMYRQVPTNAASGYATIEKIEGNTVVFNQLLDSSRKEGTSSFLRNGVTWTVNADGSVTANGLASALSQFTIYADNANFGYKGIVGHKYFTFLVVGGNDATYYGRIISNGGGIVNTFGMPNIQTCTNDTRGAGIVLRIASGYNAQNITFYPTLIDLTAIFGEGNEPTTVEEFEAWREQNGIPSWADYNAGELLSVKMSGMQTEDISQQTLDTLPFDVTTITGINTSTNVREVIFPNGMKQADREGTVKDILDLRSDTATVNCGIVNLGDLSGWQSRGADGYPKVFSINVTSSVPYKHKNDAINYICDRYTSYLPVLGVEPFSNGAPNMSISLYIGGVRLGFIYIKDDSIVASDIDNQGKIAKLNGVHLIYELATPITYTDLQDANGNPLNPRYKVEQGGTEQVLPVNTSTPTTVAPTLTTTYTKDVH